MWSFFLFIWWCLSQSWHLILIKSSLWIIYFVDCAFGVVSKKSVFNLRSSIFSLMLSVRHFIVLYLSVIYFGLTFVFYEDYNVCPDFIFYVDIHMFQPHILKRLSLLHSTAFTILSKISWLYLYVKDWYCFFIEYVRINQWSHFLYLKNKFSNDFTLNLE